MKTYLTYGFGITLAGALVTLLLFVLGYHSDPAKLQSSQTIQGIIGLAIGITGLVLGMRDLRNQSADGSLSFGRAVGAGVLIFLFAGIFGAIFQLIYGLVINPSYQDNLPSTGKRDGGERNAERPD